MYQDEETGMTYASRRDAVKVKLWTKIDQGTIRRISGFWRYAITADGEVMNVARATPVTPFVTNGRLAVSILNDSGVQKTLGLARLVASHFSAQPDEEQYYDVVHIDEDLNNVHPSNLAWVPRWKRHANQENYNIDIS